jgi:hypothetical protein
VPIISGGGGGGTPYAPPITFGIYGFASSVNIANNGISPITWAFSSGTALLGMADNTAPTVITAGIYSISCWLDPVDDMTVGGLYRLEIAAPSGDAIATDSRAATAAQLTPAASVSLTTYCAANDALQIKVRNRDGVSAIHFGLELAYVQRIT